MRYNDGRHNNIKIMIEIIATIIIAIITKVIQIILGSKIKIEVATIKATTRWHP